MNETTNQLEQVFMGRTLKLWIVQTNAGRKRTWKATEADARASIKAHGFKLKSIRPGTDNDLPA